MLRLRAVKVEFPSIVMAFAQFTLFPAAVV